MMHVGVFSTTPDHPGADADTRDIQDGDLLAIGKGRSHTVSLTP